MRSCIICVALAIVVTCLQFVHAGQKDGEGPATKPADPIDFRKLKEVLPGELAGIKRSQASGEKSSVGEWKVSQAHATYAKESDQNDTPRIEITITDYSGTRGVIDAMTAWTNMEVDREGDDGYEKSTKVAGHPALESFHNDGKTGQLQIFVARRFIVELNTSNVPAEQLKKIGEELKLENLAALK